MGDAVAARARLRPVGRGAGLRPQRADAAGHGRPPARLGGPGQRTSASCRRRAPTPPRPWPSRCSRRAPTSSPPWCSCSPPPTWSSSSVIVLVDPHGLAVRRGRVHRGPHHDHAPGAPSGRSCSPSVDRSCSGAPRPWPDAAGHDHQAMIGVSDQRQTELEAEPWSAEGHSPSRRGPTPPATRWRTSPCCEESWHRVSHRPASPDRWLSRHLCRSRRRRPGRSLGRGLARPDRTGGR